MSRYPVLRPTAPDGSSDRLVRLGSVPLTGAKLSASGIRRRHRSIARVRRDSSTFMPSISNEVLCGSTPELLHPVLRLIKGREGILRVADTLHLLAERCGQPGAMEDMAYFLSKPGLLKRTPHLMLISRGAKPTAEEIAIGDLLGAVLLYGYRVVGCNIGVFTTNDRSGRSTLIAPAPLRSRLAQFAARTLIDRGAHVVMISFRDEVPSNREPLCELSGPVSSKQPASRWACREREIAEYLPLESTYDGTLANIRPKTRTNMRSYRRRAEKELGCTSVSSVEISKKEFLAFSRQSMYAVPDRVAGWRYDILKELSAPLFMGMHDKDGRWLSLVGGRRFDSSSEILWQMNLEGLGRYSLSLVMRCYFMEHEISAGSRRFYLEGGTAHPIRHSFVNGKVIDLAVLRRSPAALVARKLARHVIPGDNELARMFSDADLEWTSPSRGPKSAVPPDSETRPYPASPVLSRNGSHAP